MNAIDGTWFDDLFLICSLILMLIDAPPISPPWLIHHPIPDHGGPYTTAEQLSIAERLRPEIWEWLGVREGHT